jgi:hypothetical protein
MPQMSRITRNNTTVTGTRESGSVTIHNTTVVSWTPDHIRLDTGGWKTSTTKTRMNQAANEYNLGFSVYQEKGRWFVWIRSTDQKLPFAGDSIEFARPEGA